MKPSRTRRLGGVRGLVALGLVSLAAMVGVQSTADAVAAGGTYARCPRGALCIYPGASFGGTPLKFYSYGPHNLVNQYGVHRIFNNQYGGAIARTCAGHNGTRCHRGHLPMGTYNDENLTPINSIVLSAHA